MNIKDQLLGQLSRTNDLPFLFIGSGMSMRYLGLETWRALLEKFSDIIGTPFGYYASSIANDYPKLASKLAVDMHELWWKDIRFEASRIAFANVDKGPQSPLKIEIAKYILEVSSHVISDSSIQEEIDLLQGVTVDGVITTNWDRFLEERIFKKEGYEVFVGQDSLIFSQPQSVAEIYKIHGCCTVPDSLVLTHEDYEGFRERNAYLAAKLLTVFVEHPIIFLGYSITDPHVRAILDSIAQCLTPRRLDQLSDRLFFVNYDFENKGDLIEKGLVSTTLPLTIIRTRDFKSIYLALSEKKRTISAKVLRKVKSHLYDLIRTNDPKVGAYVQSFDDIESGTLTPGDLNFAGFGGVSSDTGLHGYGTIKVKDLIQDVVFDDRASPYDSKLLLEHTLPDLLKWSKLVPVFKYLSKCIVAKDGTVSLEALAASVLTRASQTREEDYYPSAQYEKKKANVVANNGSVAALVDRYGAARAMTFIPLLPMGVVDLDELRAFLQDQYPAQAKAHSISSDYKRLVCFYDWLRYCPEKAVKPALP